MGAGLGDYVRGLIGRSARSIGLASNRPTGPEPTHLFLLRRHHFPSMSDDAFLAEPRTKPFQRAWLKDFILRTVRPDQIVGDIGAQAAFGLMLAANAAEKWVIDPYNNAPGGGLGEVPDLPPGIGLYRCMVGGDSKGTVPPDKFDLTVSCSVLEHIGQHESDFDCRPVHFPPAAQESARDAFCREVFRFTKPGGVTVHTIDTAARNLSYDRNFRAAGFQPFHIATEAAATVPGALHDPDVVRQRCRWTRTDKKMPEKEQRWHGVLVAAYRKPAPDDKVGGD